MPNLFDFVIYLLFDESGNLASVESRTADDEQVARNIFFGFLSGVTEGSVRFSTASAQTVNLETVAAEGYVQRSRIITEDQRREFLAILGGRSLLTEIRYARFTPGNTPIISGTFRAQEDTSAPTRKVITYFVDP